MGCIGSKDPETEKQEAENLAAVKELMAQFVLTESDYNTVSERLAADMKKGLGKRTNASASCKMFPTYVRALPDNSENGLFLALDLGGTNFRVLSIFLPSDHDNVEMKSTIYPIEQQFMRGTGEQLFDYIAKCIADFVGFHGLADQHLKLGFTFSFPCKQEGLKVGRLQKWTKGFKCSDVVGEDVVALLDKAIKKHGGIDVECNAILNDTVGCLMSVAYHDSNCKVGVILGTGTNACYFEKLDNVELWDGDHDEPREVIINTEWGSFGEHEEIDFIRTPIDKSLDKESLNPGHNIYEKMISGMYMGEITRQCCVNAILKNCLLNGKLSSLMETPHAFITEYISDIETDGASSYFPKTKAVLVKLGYNSKDITNADCSLVHYISSVISERAAYLAATGIVTLFNQIDDKSITCAVDGSLYRYHPRFHKLMVDHMKTMLKPEIDEFKLTLSTDGSGKGAALVSAVATRLEENKD